jgi:hypothetical protein
MAKKPRIFVSLRFADREYTQPIIDQVLSPNFQILPVDSIDPRPPPETVRELIGEADCFAAIATREYKIEGKKEWKTSEWVEHEIGMAWQAGKKPLMFKEKGVNLEGIAKYVTTIGEFDRRKIADYIPDFQRKVKQVANNLISQEIRKIQTREETKGAIRTVFDTAKSYVHGVVEDFTTFASFERSVTNLKDRNVEFKLICSPFGKNIGDLEKNMARICPESELRFVDESKIGRVRMLFNENIGLFVVHAYENEYFGIMGKISNELDSHYKRLLEDSSSNQVSGRIQGKFCRIKRKELADLITWAIKDLNGIPEDNRFIYILSNRFTLFTTNTNVQEALMETSKGSCKIKFILSKKSWVREGHKEPMFEIIRKAFCDCSSVSRDILREGSAFPIERRRMIIANNIAVDLLDFGSEKDYYYSTITDKEDINILKKDFEKLPIEPNCQPQYS